MKEEISVNPELRQRIAGLTYLALNKRSRKSDAYNDESEGPASIWFNNLRALVIKKQELRLTQVNLRIALVLSASMTALLFNNKRMTRCNPT